MTQVTEIVVGAGKVTKRTAAVRQPAAKIKGKPHQRPTRPKPMPTRAEYDALVARVAALEAKQPKA